MRPVGDEIPGVTCQNTCVNLESDKKLVAITVDAGVGNVLQRYLQKSPYQPLRDLYRKLDDALAEATGGC